METLDKGAALRAHIEKKYGTQVFAAAAWGVSKSFVCKVLANKRSPSNIMLRDAGIERAASNNKEQSK